MAFDDISNQLVYLKKKFRSYQKFAQKTIPDIFSPEQLANAKILTVNNFAHMVALNDGKGKFYCHDLPWQTQMAPIFDIQIFDFNNDDDLDILVGGNLYEIQPAIGKMDAGHGLLLLGLGDGHFNVDATTGQNIFAIGQVRDMELISLDNKEKAVLVARNNQSIEAYLIDSN